MSFTKQEGKEYLNSRGTKCPHCKSTKIFVNTSSDDGQPDETFKEVFCEECGNSWTEHYKLIGIINGD